MLIETRLMEQKITENSDTMVELRRLESIWDRIEIWFEGNDDEKEIRPLR